MKKIYVLILCSIAVLYAVQNAFAQKGNKKPKNIWSAWSKYGPCSATCGFGKMTKHRSCNIKKCKNGNAIHSKRCRIKKCGVWSSWSKYSECSKTCEGGTKVRLRKCKGTDCVGQDTQKKLCRFKKCKAEWGSWGKFGSCSKTCGKGEKIRWRKCRKGNCKGPAIEKKPCNTKPCPVPSVWGPWSKFAPCTKSCGTGMKKRTRKCLTKTCRGPDTQTGRCREFPCPGVWNPWSKYSECSKTCEGGTKVRQRKCKDTDCVGQDTQKKLCRFKKCKAEWGSWGKFGSCSKTCGKGEKIRSRKCRKDNCKGPAIEKKPCNTKPCPVSSVWGPWSKFAPCTKSCGTGMKKRTRKCLTKTCRGPDTQTGRCREFPCPGDWSDCTKTCGTGTRFKFDSKSCTTLGNPKCLKTFEECNKSNCPREKCDVPGMQPRYGMKHSCCAVEGGLKRVFKGEKADIEQWPWMALIELPRTRCGGSIIHQKWILTAGHCLDNLKFSERSAIKVFTGIQNYSEIHTAKPHTVAKIHRHPKYKDNLENDIALLELSEDINLSPSNISTISIPLGEETPLDSRCFAAGWGQTNPDVSSPSEPLMQVGLHVLNPSICRKAYRENIQVGEYVMKTDKLLCAGSLSSRNDTCMGDSGGPLVCQRCSSCEWYLTGVTSFGPEGDCGKVGYPGMYTRVKSYEPWIYKHIPSLRKPQKKCSYKYGP